MERLTRKMLRGYGVIEGYELNTLQGAKAVIDRLADYEDTGLEPEEIEKAMDIVKSAVSAFEDFGVDRLAELAQADREGRCVVLEKRCNDG